MPNIHVFTSDNETREHAFIIIGEALHNLKLTKDGIITPHNIAPFYADGEQTDAPYIAVSSTDTEEADSIVIELQKLNLGLDCEVWPTMRRFIPAEKMRT